MQKLAQLNEATHHWINRVETKHKQINFTWWTSWTSTLWVHFGRKRLTTRCSVWQLGGTGPNFKEFELDAALDWIVGKLELLAREWGLDLNFGSFFFFFPRSVTKRHLVPKAHTSPVDVYSTWNLQKLSSWKVSTDSMISRAMKSYTNEHTVRGGPTLKDIKRFRNGSVCKPYTRDQFTNEHFEWIYHESCYTKGAINRGHQLFNLIKSIFRSVTLWSWTK